MENIKIVYGFKFIVIKKDIADIFKRFHVIIY